MPPPIMTMETPTTTMPNIETWRRILMTFFVARKLGAMMAKNANTTTSRI